MEQTIKELERRISAIEEKLGIDPVSAGDLLVMQVVGITRSPCGICPNHATGIMCRRIKLHSGSYICLAPNNIILK